MKKRFFLGMLVCLLAFSFVFVTCDNGGGGGGGGGGGNPDTVKYLSTDTEGNTYELTITKDTSKAAYKPVAGDIYKLIILLITGVEKISNGTIFALGTNGALTLLPENYGAGTFDVTISNEKMTAINGTIAVEGGGSVELPDTPLTPGAIKNFAGNIRITPSSNVNINTELTADYNGTENVTITYQWKKDGANVGTNSETFTPTTAGKYTVTISAVGYNPKTSAVVNVTVPGGGSTTNVVGTWECEMTRKEFAEVGDMDEGFLTIMGMPEKFKFLKLVIVDDRTYTMYEYDIKTGEIDDDETETGTYTVAGNKITITPPEDAEDNEPMTGTVSGNKITFKDVPSHDTGKLATLIFNKIK